MILPKRRRHAKMNVRERPQVRCQGHLKWIRGHDCSIKGLNGHSCRGKVEAAHVRRGTDGGMGVKPSDIWTIPLCSMSHKWSHDNGEAALERLFRVNLKEIAEGLARLSPALRKRARALELEG